MAPTSIMALLKRCAIQPLLYLSAAINLSAKFIGLSNAHALPDMS